MATIEERATLDADKYVGKNENFGARQSHRLAYIRVATEQDSIARQEERSRCIKAAQEWLMEFLGDTDRDNPIVESLTKAIEKG